MKRREREKLGVQIRAGKCGWMNEDKETNIVDQVPSWHFTVCLKCNKYLSMYILY